MDCYSGTNPLGKLSDASRRALWQWVKENAIDKGMPMEQVHEELNNRLGGILKNKPEWTTEFLAARKTPFRRISDQAWAAQANRRAMVEQAKRAVKIANATKIEKAARSVLNFAVSTPRELTIGGRFHAAAFPPLHGGSMVLNPARWADFVRLVGNIYKVAYTKGGAAAAEQLQTAMRQSPRYDFAHKIGVDLSRHVREIGTKSGPSTRAFDALIETRFRIFDKMMDEAEARDPNMSADVRDSFGHAFAEMANHATGSGKGILTARIPIGGDRSISLGQGFFGPKLAQAYWNKMFGDPAKMLWTFGKMATGEKVSAGEKAAAYKRLQATMWATGLSMGTLMANQGIIMARNPKDYDRQKNLLENFGDYPNGINFIHPFKSNWMDYRVGNVYFHLPGLFHSELRLVGSLLYTAAFASNQELAHELHLPMGTKEQVSLAKRLEEGPRIDLQKVVVAKKAADYLLSKATPVVGLGQELVTGHDFMGRPLPWSSDKGSKYNQPYGLKGIPGTGVAEFVGSHLPIPLAGASKYIFEQLRDGGMSVTDAWLWMRAAAVGAVNFATGVDLKEAHEYKPPPAPARTRYGHAQVGR